MKDTFARQVAYAPVVPFIGDEARDVLGGAVGVD
jgi:hypothetical protein